MKKFFAILTEQTTTKMCRWGCSLTNTVSLLSMTLRSNSRSNAKNNPLFKKGNDF